MRSQAGSVPKVLTIQYMRPVRSLTPSPSPIFLFPVDAAMCPHKSRWIQ